jgi:hypothetical protein
MRIVAVAILGLIAVAAWAQERTASAPGAEVYIVSPHNGQTVKSPVTVRFGLKGMGIAPAGVKFDNTGHHHLLIDSELPTDMSKPLPTTDKILHFGKGQTEVTLDKDKLPPGKHTLQLVVGDMNHVPLNPPLVSKKITITVE